jgi:hypothetical protein
MFIGVTAPSLSVFAGASVEAGLVVAGQPDTLERSKEVSLAMGARAPDVQQGGLLAEVESVGGMDFKCADQEVVSGRVSEFAPRLSEDFLNKL